MDMQVTPFSVGLLTKSLDDTNQYRVMSKNIIGLFEMFWIGETSHNLEILGNSKTDQHLLGLFREIEPAITTVKNYLSLDEGHGFSPKNLFNFHFLPLQQ